MDLVKQVFKFIAALAIGICVGLLIAVIIILLFTDTTFSEFVTKLRNIDYSEAIAAALTGIVSFFVSLAILVTIHEAGHLLCGLLSGYKFVSFRIFNFTFIKLDGKIRVKRFAIAGTGGQCLLSPPDLPLKEIPVFWYNSGGVLANIAILFIAVPLLLLADLNPFVTEALAIFILTDILMILTNGIPLKIGGIGNDAYNILLLRRSELSKHGLMIQLRSNALIQEGVRPKDMPDEWFSVPDGISYRNALEVSIPLMAASRLIDTENWEEAYQMFDNLYSHKSEILTIYVKEIACELAFTSLVTGRTEQAEQLLDTDLMKYIETYRKVMSSKERILCAIDLYLKHDRTAAMTIYETLKQNQSKYLLQGEVKSDIAIMENFFS